MASVELCDSPNCKQIGEVFTISPHGGGAFKVSLCQQHQKAVRAYRDWAERGKADAGRRGRVSVDRDYLASLIERK